jgi:hypothetical protein
VVRIFIQSAKAFSIHDDNIDGVTLRSEPLNGSSPHPDSLGARVNSGADTESSLSIEEHSIEEIAFASTIHTGYRNNSYWTFEFLKILPALFVEFEH